MKKTTIAFMTAAMLLLSGCGSADGASGETAGRGDDMVDASGTVTEEASDSVGQETASGEANVGDQAGSVEGYESEESGEKQYTWQEYTVTLPDGWEGRCVMEESEVGFSIYQRASYEKDDAAGYICGFFRTREPVEYDYGKEIIAYTEDGTLYYMVQPTDVPCDTEDGEIAGEYIRMCQQASQLKRSLRLAVSGVHYHADEYIFPTSSIFPLDPMMLKEFSDNNLQIARNEIYARHGRQFANGYLQEYFNRCTWYEGEIPPQEFQESVLSQVERDNIKLLSAAEKEYERQHPYPKSYQMSENVSEDLNGDGTADTINCRVIEQENGEILCTITINDETWDANELVRSELEEGMTDSIWNFFYVTDIQESDGLLEIALLDNGPSEDPITYFFRYDGALSCIGLVPGFPFADMNGGRNGFNGYGGITGRAPMDLLETAFLQYNCRYDGVRILDSETAWYEYDYLLSRSHTLYEDLPVYCEREETSAMTVIPAQEEVFFLGTDGEQWILVKGRDGSRGYMLVEDGRIVTLDKPAEEVFSGLQFSG